VNLEDTRQILNGKNGKENYNPQFDLLSGAENAERKCLAV
jgi:hypothetical protein